MHQLELPFEKNECEDKQLFEIYEVNLRLYPTTKEYGTHVEFVRALNLQDVEDYVARTRIGKVARLGVREVTSIEVIRRMTILEAQLIACQKVLGYLDHVREE